MSSGVKGPDGVPIATLKSNGSQIWGFGPFFRRFEPDPGDYLRVELHHTAENEMVTRLDDFLRRRSKISLVVRDRDVRDSDGLSEVAEILFGAKADEKLTQHFGANFTPVAG